MIKIGRLHIIECMLKRDTISFYKVQKGEGIEGIARLFSLPPSLLVYENQLSKEVEEGEVLRLPKQSGNLYLVKIGDKKEDFFASEEEFQRKNGTKRWFVGQRIFLRE